MKIAELAHFPLKDAYVCLELDCQSIHNSNSFCPACSSTSLLPLTKWIAAIYKEKECQPK